MHKPSDKGPIEMDNKKRKEKGQKLRIKKPFFFFFFFFWENERGVRIISANPRESRKKESTIDMMGSAADFSMGKAFVTKKNFC